MSPIEDHEWPRDLMTDLHGTDNPVRAPRGRRDEVSYVRVRRDLGDGIAPQGEKPINVRPRRLEFRPESPALTRVEWFREEQSSYQYGDVPHDHFRAEDDPLIRAQRRSEAGILLSFAETPS
jgi:hypothetical protein